MKCDEVYKYWNVWCAQHVSWVAPFSSLFQAAQIYSKSLPQTTECSSPPTNHGIHQLVSLNSSAGPCPFVALCMPPPLSSVRLLEVFSHWPKTGSSTVSFMIFMSFHFPALHQRSKITAGCEFQFSNLGCIMADGDDAFGSHGREDSAGVAVVWQSSNGDECHDIFAFDGTFNPVLVFVNYAMGHCLSSLLGNDLFRWYFGHLGIWDMLFWRNCSGMKSVKEIVTQWVDLQYHSNWPLGFTPQFECSKSQLSSAVIAVLR